MNFAQAIEHVLASEGGYVNNPADRGGETKWGISKRSYPGVDIKGLTRLDAIALYRRDYWQAARCDVVPDALRLVYFDHAVNAGVVAAVKLLQVVVGAVADGDFGPRTEAMCQLLAGQPAAIIQYAKEDMLWLRARHYARLARDNKSQQGFLAGWILRLIAVRKEVG